MVFNNNIYIFFFGYQEELSLGKKNVMSIIKRKVLLKKKILIYIISMLYKIGV